MPCRKWGSGNIKARVRFRNSAVVLIVSIHESEKWVETKAREKSYRGLMFDISRIKF